MQKRKARAFKEHNEIIQCLWYLGKGIMFRKHLIKYFTLHGHREKVVVEALRDLIDSDLVKSERVGNSHVLILRKYSIYTLLEKKPNQVDSVRRTNEKTLRSAFLNARILDVLSADVFRLEKGFEYNMRRILRLGSYAAREKRSYEAFVNLEKFDEKLLKKKKPRKYLSDTTQIEIQDLRIIRGYSEKRKWKDEAEAIRIKKDRGLSIDAINLNSLHSRDIYFNFRPEEGQFVLDLDFLDHRSTMTQSQLETKLKLAIPYMSDLVNPSIQIQVNVLVASEIRRDYFDSRVDKVMENVSQATKNKNVRMQTVNLNLEETLFAGMTIIS